MFQITFKGSLVEVDKDLANKIRYLNENESSDEESGVNSVGIDHLNLSLENKQYANLNKINLDVSTLLALVSDLSNGHTNFVFDKDYLNQQAESERKAHLVPILEELMKGYLIKTKNIIRLKSN